jgi:DNA-binding MarR family transcriptional regulator
MTTLTGQDIAEAQGAVRALLERRLATSGSGISGDEYVALLVLAARGPIASAELHGFLAGQRQLGLDATGVAALLDGLERRGLMTGADRDGTEPARLTERGVAVQADLVASAREVSARLYGSMDPDDLAVAHRVLVDVTARATELTSAM